MNIFHQALIIVEDVDETLSNLHNIPHRCQRIFLKKMEQGSYLNKHEQNIQLENVHIKGQWNLK